MRVKRNTWGLLLEKIGNEKLQEMYCNFKSVYKISKILGIPDSAIYNYFENNNMDDGRSKKIVDISFLINAEIKYVSISDMLSKIGCSQETLKRSFKHHKLPYPNFRGKYDCNENFFDINNLNEKSMYWAGFMAADGNLRISNGSYYIKLELSTKDKNHIEKFKQDIQSTGRIIDGRKKASKLLQQNKNCQEWYYYSYLLIISNKIFNDLGKFGITPRKTYTYTMPQWLIEHPLINHFIRGYMDADGSYTINKRKEEEVSLHISLPGACPAVKQIWEIIKRDCEVKYGNFLISRNDKGLPFYKFLFNGLKDNVNIVDYLFNNSTVFMDRKKARADKAKIYLEQSSGYFLTLLNCKDYTMS